MKFPQKYSKIFLREVDCGGQKCDFQAFEKTACPYRFLINLVDFLLKMPMVALI